MISKNLAQKIVDKMMDIIPYNVNIMDKNGVIIGSGDESRIGQLHLGAIESLKLKKATEVNKENNGVKPGVNIPITLNNRIIGVIGITGNPRTVRPFGEIVRVTSELLINQEYSIQKYIVKNKIKEEYLYEWLYRKEVYDKEFIERGIEVEIDIQLNRTIVLIEYRRSNNDILRKTIDSFIKKNEFIIHINSNRLVLILKSKIDSMEKRIEELIGDNKEEIVRVIYNKAEEVLAKSFYKLLNALNIANKLNLEATIISLKDINFLSEVDKMTKNKDNKEIIEKLIKHGGDLLETFIVFVESNYEKQITYKNLHIHRNTLAYRIAKIEELTELCFNNAIDCYRLTSAYIYYKVIYSSAQ
ncbi:MULTISPECIES: sugar diacid recognition domain-containing protein [Clostridium]|uniref:CdaR family transcriptional regulator n=1 Tax=Clostridium TaxID=1485 RepID=UPI0018996BD1|nr:MULTISPECIES: sugar diacid recognition domain-containing protein [Clostridium]MCR1951098.1 helix-turn-helix domain-containing protein [Clostridium sp. DSM 100503]MDI9218233.1 helix-turn-helix domain-containing protein [Clostridium tertium]